MEMAVFGLVVRLTFGIIIGLVISVIMEKINSKKGIDTSEYKTKGLLYGAFYGFMGLPVFVFAFIICFIPMLFSKNNVLARYFLKYIPITSVVILLLSTFGQMTR